MSVAPKAVIFDLFGTLVKTYDSHTVNQKIASALCVSVNDLEKALAVSADQRYRGVFPTTEAMFEHICHLLGAMPSKRTLAQVCGYRLEATKRQLNPRAQTIPTLTRLKQLGYKLGLISDCSPDVPPLYSKTPLANLVDSSVLSCSVGLKKPDPKIYELTCKSLGVTPDQCVYVGDGGSDELIGAKSVGMRSLLLRVPSDETSQSEARSWQGETVDGLEELFEFLRHSRTE